jgi:hypothetical protein
VVENTDKSFNTLNFEGGCTAKVLYGDKKEME